MKTFYPKHIRPFLLEEEAATAVEYGVMLMLIAGVCLTAIQLVGGEAQAIWTSNSDQLDASLNSSN